MSGDNSAAQRRLEQVFETVISGSPPGTGSSQFTWPASVPTVLGPYERNLAGSPATRIVGSPTTHDVGQSPSGAYPGLSSVGAQPFSVRLGGMAEASHQTPNARRVASPIRIGGQPPMLALQNQASLVHLPDSPPDVAMALVPLAPAEDRLVAGLPAGKG